MIWKDPERECHCRIDEPDPDQEGTLDESDRKVLADVDAYGWHLVQILDDPQSSGWVFSVGMWHSLGSPELAVFGLASSHAANLINQVGARIRSGEAIGPDVVISDLLEDGRPVTFRAVDDSWHRPMFGFATWFGRRPPLPVAQVVWADAHGRFLWDEGVDDWYRTTQPSLWIPAAEHPRGQWTATEGPNVR